MPRPSFQLSAGRVILNDAFEPDYFIAYQLQEFANAWLIEERIRDLAHRFIKYRMIQRPLELTSVLHRLF